MNKRTRQWLKASEMLDKYDPEIMATVKDFETESGQWRKIVFFRRSQLNEMHRKYGEDLEVIYGDL